ncbi:MAG TPA: OsmC family protein, partial [Rhizomicrobium sp.]
MSGTNVTVTEEGGRRFAQLITAGQHVLVADEAAAAGGDDAGPSPADLLLASLGACAAITLRMYAERHGWALGHLVVELSWLPQGGIRRDIHFGGALADEQKTRLLGIARRCPISRLLQTGAVVDAAPAGAQQHNGA